MGGETVNGSWFSTLWPVSRKTTLDDKGVIGILASEVAGLMLKVVSLWYSLSDNELTSLKEEIRNSVGIKMLVSDDDNFLMELVLDEILDNFQSIAKYVAKLGKRCVDPVYHRYEQFVNNPAQNCFPWSGWEYRLKKMERKMKKMERFVAAMTQLSQELEVLAELEQTLRRMQANPDLNRVKLPEFRKKVMWQRQEVRNLRDMSPWNRSYDYVVRMLVRSLFTILERIIVVFGKNQLTTEPHEEDCQHVNTNILSRSLSFSAFMHSSVHPSENDIRVFQVDKNKRKNKQQQALQTPALHGKHQRLGSKQFGHIAVFKGCMSVGNDSFIVSNCMSATGGSMRLNDCHINNVDKMHAMDKSSLSSRNKMYSKLSSKGLLLRAPPFTLGDAALALHYANVIVLIERMVSSPEIIDPDMRDDLYNMLPKTLRSALRAKLKFYAKCKASIVYDAALAAEWGIALARILEWLAPLAHNMIRWHSGKNFEKEQATSKENVLLVQTLYFANLAKTEAAILELLVGLNYVCKIDGKVGIKDQPEFAGPRYCNAFRLRKKDITSEFL